MNLEVVPITFRAACAFVAEHHRHHKPPRGMKFCLAVADQDGRIVGVAMVGRPVAHSYDDGRTAEVNRTCVLDGARNANSMLYGAAWRAARAMEYRRLITYTQAGESSASLRGAGWVVVAERPARKGWNCPARPRDDHGADGVQRTLWDVSA